MTTLLVMTTGQTDVQLVVDDQRHKLDRDTCGTLHDAISRREWFFVDAPGGRGREPIKKLPEGRLKVCTPKLDAILSGPGYVPTSALIFETRRENPSDPRLAGMILEQRLRERGVKQVTRIAFLTGTQKQEERTNPLDAVVRREVVATLAKAIASAITGLNGDDRVVLAATGGLPATNEVVKELVRLHAAGGPRVTSLEVPDDDHDRLDDHAVEERFHPAAAIRARWHALSLIQNGSLLAAWGAVSHLEDEPGQEWTKVVRWLANFAASLPIRDCEIPVLSHKRMSVRAALRVELALRAGDIPRAVHGTVAFYESALWDHLLERFERTGAKQCGLDVLRIKSGVPKSIDRKLLRNEQSDEKEKRRCCFERVDESTYLFFEDGAGKFAKYYVQSRALKDLVAAVGSVKALRNDVAHNEPTPDLMQKASRRMIEAQLWSSEGRFLTQPLVRDVLEELGVTDSEKLCKDLLVQVRQSLIAGV